LPTSSRNDVTISNENAFLNQPWFVQASECNLNKGGKIGLVIGTCIGTAVTYMTFKPVDVTSYHPPSPLELFTNVFFPFYAPFICGFMGAAVGELSSIYRSWNEGESTNKINQLSEGSPSTVITKKDYYSIV